MKSRTGISVPHDHHKRARHIVIHPRLLHKMTFVRTFTFLALLVALATAERIAPG